MSSLDSWPILFVFAAIVGLTFIASELGFIAGTRTRARKDGGLEKYPIESSASGIVLGLLAFILAFSFGAVANRYTESRQIALDDTDAISDAYMMADFLPDESAKKVRNLLHEYHRTRLDGIKSRDTTKLSGAINRAEEIHQELWAIAVDVRKANNNSILNQFVTMINAMMDTHTLRVHKGLNSRMPTAIWWTIAGLLSLSSLLLGLSAGLHGRRSRLASMIVILCFSSVIAMIVDLDRPFRTLFTKSQDPTAGALLKHMESRGSGITE